MIARRRATFSTMMKRHGWLSPTDGERQAVSISRSIMPGASGSRRKRRTSRRQTNRSRRRRRNASSKAAASLPLTTSAGENRTRSRVHAFVGRRDDAPAAFRGAAIPRGDDASGTGEDRDEGNDGVAIELGLDAEVDVAGCQHAIGVAVAAVAREPHRLFDL